MKRLALLLLPFAALAQDSRLEAIRTNVLGMRQYAKDHQDLRGAAPEIASTKRQIAEWIESRLATFPPNGDPAALTAGFHNALRDAGLFCDNDSDCFPTSLGFLDEIQITRQDQFLIAITAVGVGIRCGYDYSAYIYQWREGKWQRVWQSEQKDDPQLLHSVQISKPDPDGARLVLTLGTQSGCLTFKNVYYRVWRLGMPAPILDRSERLYDEGDPPATGKIQPNDVRIQFSAGGAVDGYPHKALRHFEIRGTTAKQIDPIAPTPHDFIEEWLAADWSDSGRFAESPALREWHQKLHRDDQQGDFPDDPVNCTGNPELWQIATHIAGEPKRYFLVRWHRPDRFTMVAVSDQPLTQCEVPAK